jgi:hypothetical protein
VEIQWVRCMMMDHNSRREIFLSCKWQFATKLLCCLENWEICPKYFFETAIDGLVKNELWCKSKLSQTKLLLWEGAGGLK